nr:claudin-10 isoform X4 [Danio rerio]|eukprot:XP_683803.3 claudin-10 isoform X4 [Danio rerio]
MNIRTMQVWGFLLSVTGWIFVSCSMAMEAWKVAPIGGVGGSNIISVGWHWSSLWRECFTDSASTTRCYDFPVLWAVKGYLQIVRALLMAGMGVGVLAIILSLVGMECTYIGGNDNEKNRSVRAAGICHVSGGLLASAGYAVYAERIYTEYYNPTIAGLQYELGVPLFLGWSGCAVQITGGAFFLVSVSRLSSQTYIHAPTLSVPVVEANALRSSRTNISIISEHSTNSKTSAVSALSSKSEITAVSKAPSKKSRASRSERPSRPRRSDKPRDSVRSEVSESVSFSRSSGTSRQHINNKASSTSRGTSRQFIKSSYL